MKKFITLSLLVCAAGLMAAGIDLNLLDNYSRQPLPAYIRLTPNLVDSGRITDEGATLGRVLFYDKNLSATNTVSCGSCHHQPLAFGDTAVQSTGVHGRLTTRHAMRLVNARFGSQQTFFWDQRAKSLEAQVTQPLRNHLEMGFSGVQGDPDMDSLIRKLQSVNYYPSLFELAFGDSAITENRIKLALAQFVRSIQSFDAKYDSGRALVGSNVLPFPNFSPQENEGKRLFFLPPASDGAGCFMCHNGPVFDIVPNSGNNNVISVAGQPDSIDLTGTRAPSLRDLVNPSGNLNGPLMHDGSINSLGALIDHYNFIASNPANTNLSKLLKGQNLQLDAAKKDALIAFLKTLTGSNIYIDKKWSDPFDANGNLRIISFSNAIAKRAAFDAVIYPNPATTAVNIQLPSGSYMLEISDAAGRRLQARQVSGNHTVIDLSRFPNGILQFRIIDPARGRGVVRLVTKAG